MTAVIPERPSGRPVSSPWLMGLALSLVSEGCDDELAIKHLLFEAGESRHLLEGAYGRGVALAAEYPDDPLVKATLDLVTRTLHRVLRAGDARP